LAASIGDARAAVPFDIKYLARVTVEGTDQFKKDAGHFDALSVFVEFVAIHARTAAAILNAVKGPIVIALSMLSCAAQIGTGSGRYTDRRITACIAVDIRIGRAAAAAKARTPSDIGGGAITTSVFNAAHHVGTRLLRTRAVVAGAVKAAVIIDVYVFHVTTAGTGRRLVDVRGA
jgi:hypothetical protein